MLEAFSDKRLPVENRHEMTTVEPRHTTTFWWPEHKSPLIFLSENPVNPITQLLRPTTTHTLSRYFLYKITPLIRPVKMLGGAAE